MRRLSRSIADMKIHYDAVVVGSGYGGGVAASRLARMGRRVAVLERGREFAIGDFPDRMNRGPPGIPGYARRPAARLANSACSICGSARTSTFSSAAASAAVR